MRDSDFVSLWLTKYMDFLIQSNRKHKPVEDCKAIFGKQPLAGHIILVEIIRYDSKIRLSVL